MVEDNIVHQVASVSEDEFVDQEQTIMATESRERQRRYTLAVETKNWRRLSNQRMGMTSRWSNVSDDKVTDVPE